MDEWSKKERMKERKKFFSEENMCLCRVERYSDREDAPKH